MEDIRTRSDIDLLLRNFYSSVRKDPSLGYIFDDIMHVNWEEHIPIITDFWETILLDSGSYTRNAMGEHFKINQKIKLEASHFQQWLHLFDTTIDEMFAGEKASLAKKRAHSVASLMQLKILQLNQ
jgi:hemoglobin